MRRVANRNVRPGFTLVELLVSMGLTLFIMVILVEAFTAGLATFQGLRAMGALQNQARSAMQLLRNDLQQDHFEGSRKISDANFWTDPRREGFFVMRQGSAASTVNPMYRDEGPDLDGANNSFLARDHVLHFSSRLKGNRRENFVYDSTAIPTVSNYRISVARVLLDAFYGFDFVVTASSTTSTFSSQWCEIAYVLVPAQQPQQQTIPDSGVTLHNLYRVCLLVVPFTDDLNNKNPIPYALAPDGVSPKNFQLTSQKNANGNYRFFSPNDLAKGAATRCFQPAAAMDVTNLRGKSLACTNVVSFQTRILKDGAINYEDPPGNSLDSAIKPVGAPRIMGMQVILRVYDPAMGITRQVTMIQDL